MMSSNVLSVFVLDLLILIESLVYIMKIFFEMHETVFEKNVVQKINIKF